MLEIDKYNEDVQGWGNAAVKILRSSASGYGITHRSNSPSPGPSLSKLKTRFKYQSGLINVISFSLPRHLIFVHKGAGKGRGGLKGSRWVDKYGNRQKTNPASLGKMGTGGRVEKPFINDTLGGPQGVEHLADIVAERTGDIIVANILIK